MSNSGLYRAAGASGVLSIGLLAVEILLYSRRGPLPTNAASSLSTYAVRNADNMIAVVLLDVLVCAFVLLFLAGFRRLVREAQPSSMWLATQVFGAGVAYAMLSLFGDLMQGIIAINALQGDPDPSLIRAFLADGLPAFGVAGLIVSAALLAAAAYVSRASHALPKITSWFGYLGAIACIALIPFAGSQGRGLSALVEIRQWNADSLIAALPIAAWMIVAGVAMFNVPEPKTADLSVTR